MILLSLELYLQYPCEQGFRYLHHCFSHGMPSLFPSIFTPGQFFKKNVASAQEVICEQYVLPSHLNDDDVANPRATDDGVWNVYFGSLRLARLLERHMRI